MNIKQSTPYKPQPVAKPLDAKAPAPTPNKQSLVRLFASRYHVDADKLLATLKDTAFRQPFKDGKPGPEVTDSQMMALLVVANEYKLNPFTREIYAFAGKGGGIVPIVSIDGWIRIVNERPELEWFDFRYPEQPGERADYWVECTMKRKDRERPVSVTEYFSECYRDTDPWNATGRRMNRHRAFIQCARLVFGFSGIYDPDEARRVAEAMAIDTKSEDITGRGKPITREPQAKIAAPTADQPQASLVLEDSESNRKEIQRLLDSSGVPETALLAHFEVGSFEEFTPVMDKQAIEWLKQVQP